MRNALILLTLAAFGAVNIASAQAPVAKQPRPKSQKEVDAVMAVFNAADESARIAAVESLLVNFVDTEFKAVALQLATDAASRKGDFEQMMVYGERALEADPKNFAVMLMLSSAIAQRTREFDLDKEEKLKRSEKMANDAMGLIPNAAKPRADIPDADWENAKKDFLAQAHESLGLAAQVRNKYDVAITEFQAAVSGGAQTDPSTIVRLANAYNQTGKPDEAIKVLEPLMSKTDIHPQVKAVAESELKRANAAKAQAK